MQQDWTADGEDETVAVDTGEVRAEPESRHVSIQNLPLSAISPSPENAKLYRPVDPNDPDVCALAASIAQHGVREPLVITNDRFIISGHRRYVAAQSAGLTEVPCRVEAINHDDPAFLPLLREHNRQRVKSFDESFREAVVSTNADDAHRALVEHRRRSAQVHADVMVIEGTKHRAEISRNKQPFVDAIVNILERLREFWPLSDRQVHYQLLNDPPLIHAKKPESHYRNDRASYKSLTDLLTRARLKGLVPWHALDDPTRPVTRARVFDDIAPFIQDELDKFLNGYFRNYMQSQPNHIEIVGEKLTVEGTIKPVALDYCIPLTIGRGYCSSPPRHAMAERFHRSGKENLVVLMLSDFDPDGREIAQSFARSMRDDFGISNIVPIRVALTGDQVKELGLPPVMKAKRSSHQYGKFVEMHGDNVHELEAVEPTKLQTILRTAIDSVLDIKALNREIDAEKADAQQLAAIRRTVLADLPRHLGIGA
jgi:hypothetical protein